MGLIKYTCFLTIVIILLLEFAYRMQVIEFYQNAFSALNPAFHSPSKQNSDTTVLVIGDSFTAQKENYVGFLRSEYPQWQFINASVPGTGIRQHELYFNKRIKQHPPDVLIYQFYVGNDLTDVIHPYHYDSLSLIRNAYWWLSDRLLVVPYLNSVLSSLSVRMGTKQEVSDSPFKKECYNARTKLYIKANSKALQQTILLDESMEMRYQIWQNKFHHMLSQLPSATKVYLLVIPHYIQSSTKHLNNYRLLGATVDERLLASNYPLINRMKQDFADVTMINPLPDFQKAEHPSEIYLQNDPHLTVTGQKKLTATILQVLNEGDNHSSIK
ncbi:MAG: hypothetical protein AB8G22_07140 [Saprospiraceae bacterium]